MQRLQAIRQPIAHEMEEFERRFRDSMRTRVSLLDRIMQYIIKRKGKQMRPMLVFLSAGTCGPINDRTYRGATLVELLHTATLIHDDVVDDSFERRGMFSINALWKNKVAVLVGDYLLSKGLLLSVDHGDFDLLKISSEAVRLMSEGELLQLERSRHLNQNEELYYEIIRMKTASLIASCCAMGAQSTASDDDQVARMRLFGEKVGMAFQVKDDLFDYGDNQSGKPSGNDLKEKKLTLPLIHALNNANGGERKYILRIIRGYKADRRQLAEIVAFVDSKGGIDYARQVMERFRSEAVEILESFPPSPYRQSLEALVDFTISRDR